MKLVSLEDIPYDKRSVITVGTFDGIHLAHREILSTVVGKAKENGCRSVIVTFDPHPRDVIKRADGAITELLTTLEERRELCGKLGIDYFLVMKFDRDLARQSFRDFYVKYLVEKIGVFMVVEGYNHHWGKDRLGNMELLKEIGKEFDFSVVSVGKIRYGDATVNSSLIREKLKDGKVEEAEELLGRPYRLSGTVVSGNKRGKSLGYPTANIKPDSPSKLLPKDGIYFVQAVIEERKYSGMASIGVRPTFESDGKRTVEVNIFDFDKDIYGRKLEVFFFRRLRDEFKYITKDELIRQMDRDKELSRKYESEIKNKI